MPDQRTLSVAEADRMIDSGILGLLIRPDHRRLWSQDEIERDINDPVAVADSLHRLYGGGLIHRLDRFVWASRAAIMAEEIKK
jgi:hypothetical protein